MNELQIGFPFAIDDRGRVADPDYEEHVRQLIEQLLFTDPGERVNRPDFGCGLLRLVFAPGSVETVAAAQHLVQAALYRWLNDVIQVEGVRVRMDGDELQVIVTYLVRRNQQRRVETFDRRGWAWRG